MTIDMTNNRVPYGLLTDEEKAALHDHQEDGGKIEYWCGIWEKVEPTWHYNIIYRTVPLPEKTQDVIAWDRLPDWVAYVARYIDGSVWCFGAEPIVGSADYRRIDDFPGIVLEVGTCGWKDSKQRRPK
jgi:hypothetical protein